MTKLFRSLVRSRLIACRERLSAQKGESQMKKVKVTSKQLQDQAAMAVIDLMIAMDVPAIHVENKVTCALTFKRGKGQEHKIWVSVIDIIGGQFCLQIESPSLSDQSPFGTDSIYDSPNFRVRWFHRGHLPTVIKAAMCGQLGHALRDH